MSRDTAPYHLDGHGRLVSVTEALHLAGLVDFSGVHPDRLEFARQRGQDVHEWLDGFDAGRLPDTMLPPDHIAKYVEAWVRFRDETDFEPVEIEQPARHDTFLFAGTPDRVGLLRGDSTLVEIKAVAQLDPWVALQTAGYELLQGETLRRIAVQLLPDGRYRMQEYHHRLRDRHGFLGALALAKWRRAAGFAIPQEDTGEE